jgi:hypothetical protein
MFRALIYAGALLLGAVIPFTERTKTDFDTFLRLLNPYGHWVKQSNVWFYEPFQPYIPLTEGQWIYTDFGWYWNGTRPFSWATDHYGAWKLGQDNVWRWKPDPDWQPAKVEWRGTSEFIGWRATSMNRFGEITEPEAERYNHPGEWIFVPRKKLTGSLTPADIITGEKGKTLLDQSEAVNHTYVSWREIDRLGPDPYDVYGVAKSFLAQQTMGAQAEKAVNIAGDDDASPIIVAAPAPSAGSADSKDKEKEKKPPIYTIYSLPDFYYIVKFNPLKPFDLYIYRPEIFQDSDGIQRRLDVWHNPKVQKANLEKVNRVLEHGTLIIDGKGSSTSSSTTAAPVDSASASTASDSDNSTPTSTASTTTTSSSGADSSSSSSSSTSSSLLRKTR